MLEEMNDWIGRLLEGALTVSPVDAEIVRLVRGQLNSDMQKRALRPPELVKLAKDLLTVANPGHDEAPK
jgi:hypothetical protein